MGTPDWQSRVGFPLSQYYLITVKTRYIYEPYFLNSYFSVAYSLFLYSPSAGVDLPGNLWCSEGCSGISSQWKCHRVRKRLGTSDWQSRVGFPLSQYYLITVKSVFGASRSIWTPRWSRSLEGGLNAAVFADYNITYFCISIYIFLFTYNTTSELAPMLFLNKTTKYRTKTPLACPRKTNLIFSSETFFFLFLFLFSLYERNIYILQTEIYVLKHIPM